MSKKRTYDKLTGMNLVNLMQTKQGFLLACKQYDRLGLLLAHEAKAISHVMFSKTSAPGILQSIMEQYKEIGEQLKQIGEGLDKLGGDPVLEKTPSFTEPKLKKTPKEFVSNIPPASPGEVADTMLPEKEEKKFEDTSLLKVSKEKIKKMKKESEKKNKKTTTKKKSALDEFQSSRKKDKTEFDTKNC